MENHSLIEEIKSRDSEKSLEKIYSDYRNEFMLWAIRNHECSMDEAKDVFQQSVIIFYENIKSGKLTQLTTKVKTYLFSIGKNKILELIRAKNKQQGQYYDQVYMDNDYLYHEADEEYEVKLMNVENCLIKMGHPCKRILEQYYYHRKSMMEISEIMDYKNSDTVKNLKYKCLQKLRQIFKSKFETFNEQTT